MYLPQYVMRFGYAKGTQTRSRQFFVTDRGAYLSRKILPTPECIPLPADYLYQKIVCTHPPWPPTKPPTNREMEIRPVPMVGSSSRRYRKGPQQSGGHDGVRRFFNGCMRSCGSGVASAAARKTRGAAPQLLVFQLKNRRTPS